MLVTDPIEPLSSQLNQDPDKNLVIWGLYKVAVSLLLVFTSATTLTYFFLI